MKDWDNKVDKANKKQSKKTGSKPAGKIIPADLNMDDEEAPESDPEEDSGPSRSAFTKENDHLPELNLTSTISNVNIHLNQLKEFDKIAPLEKRELSGKADASGQDEQPPLSQMPKGGLLTNIQLANIDEQDDRPPEDNQDAKLENQAIEDATIIFNEAKAEKEKAEEARERERIAKEKEEQGRKEKATRDATEQKKKEEDDAKAEQEKAEQAREKEENKKKKKEEERAAKEVEEKEQRKKGMKMKKKEQR